MLSRRHLASAGSVHRAALSVAARGLSGQTYKGAIFWDTEMFMLDFYLACMPEVARHCLEYRVQTLPATGKRMLYLIAAMLLALVLWSVAFVASANYQSKAIWSMPQEEWQSYPEVAAWMQHCETMGNGVYMQRVDLPYDQGNTTAYLVCRNGVTNEQAGKITPNPLRLRFWVTYQAGESDPMMLDVLTFQGNKDYQVFFRIGKDQSDCIFTTNESEALAGEVRSLLESRANDK